MLDTLARRDRAADERILGSCEEYATVRLSRPALSDHLRGGRSDIAVGGGRQWDVAV